MNMDETILMAAETFAGLSGCTVVEALTDHQDEVFMLICAVMAEEMADRKAAA